MLFALAREKSYWEKRVTGMCHLHAPRFRSANNPNQIHVDVDKENPAYLSDALVDSMGH